jgi:hypothetical protein
MKKPDIIKSSEIFRQAVLIALMEQGKIDPTPLRAFLLRVLEAPLLVNKKIEWLLAERPSLIVFYNSLKSHEYISCDYEFFRNHFIEGTETPKDKITWEGNLNELITLFARLRDEKIIPYRKDLHILLWEHFLDRNGKPLKTRSSSASLRKGVKNADGIEFINEILKDVLAIKNF